jgi:hypothetical protein
VSENIDIEASYEQEGTMRKGVLAAVGLAFLAAVSWSAAPARAMAISAPAALKGASDSINLTETVHCWNCGYWGGPRYYRSYYRPFYRPYYRPYYRAYYDAPPYYYRPRPYYRPYWGGGYGGYGGGYGYYAPRPRFFVGPSVYWY